MTDHLPSDPADWPDDPFELLNVSPSVQRRDARRAYLKLVRQYKPDQFPTEFQKIREAFESVDQLLQSPWAQYLTADDDEGGDYSQPETSYEANDGPLQENNLADFAPADDDDSFPSQTVWRDSSHGEEQQAANDFASYQPGSTGTRVKGIWRRARAGEWDDAYVLLLSRHREADNNAELYAAGYWLLKIVPEIDKERRPQDWLYDGMRNCGLQTDLTSLYRAELSRLPLEATQAESARLLELESSHDELAALARDRWHALFRVGRPDLIPADLVLLEKTIGQIDERLWLQTMLAAMNYVLFAQRTLDFNPVAYCHQQVDRMPYLQLEADALLDRFEMQVELAQELQALQQGGPPDARVWSDVIPTVWNLAYPEARERLDNVITRLGNRPQESLDKLDGFERFSSIAALELCQFLEEARGSCDRSLDDVEDSDPQLANDLAHAFISACDQNIYHRLRHAMLRFCTVHAVSPFYLANFVDEWLSFQDPQQSWRTHLESDFSLRTVYAGYRLFWT